MSIQAAGTEAKGQDSVVCPSELHKHCPEPFQCPEMQQLLITAIIFFVMVAHPAVALAAVTGTTTNNASNRPTYLLHATEIKRVQYWGRGGGRFESRVCCWIKRTIQMPTTQMNTTPIHTNKCFISFLSVT